MRRKALLAAAGSLIAAGILTTQVWSQPIGGDGSRGGGSSYPRPGLRDIDALKVPGLDGSLDGSGGRRGGELRPVARCRAAWVTVSVTPRADQHPGLLHTVVIDVVMPGEPSRADEETVTRTAPCQSMRERIGAELEVHD